jgi:hypothetical protein
MESMGPWKMIKSGFWLGIGFILPMIGFYILIIVLAYSMSSLWRTTGMKSSNETMERYMSDSDKTNQVRIIQFREVKNGKQLLILGTIENTGETPVGSIQIEAELLDSSRQMVFECSEYISKKLKKGENENFQVKCGCGDQPLPEHKSVSVRVVQASNY